MQVTTNLIRYGQDEPLPEALELCAGEATMRRSTDDQ